MSKLNCFIENDETIKEKFLLYAAPEIGLYIHSKEIEDFKKEIEDRNLVIKKLMERAKKEQEQKTETPEDKNDDDFTVDDLLPTIDINKIVEEQAKNNPALRIENGFVSILYDENNITEFNIEIRQPSTSDVLNMQQASMISINGRPTLDENVYRHIRLINLLKGWNLQREDKNGNLKEVPVNEQNIGKLHPKVYNAIMFYIDKNIDMHLDNLRLFQ